ncbi:hypothetical protein QSV08_14420 [Maribacter sp. BPC-D8]|uniref:hypothetical protein n=1 Tax=Maribacter sp. BPC-D8 TaxID=3053613 RepID=UPI002B4A4350|nr:hypothetical protein [Maribacter sp. BPC-D8]WRI28409.1 hypothetical protein QSV08_14420 [Maribacter sp. BPC-D8]
MISYKTYILITFFLTITYCSYAQVKIGDDVSSIHNSSLLELESTSKVLVLSRVSNTQMLQITPLNGAMVYNIDNQCVFTFNGTQWINLCDTNSNTISIIDNEDGSFTITSTDGTSFTSGDLSGAQGEQQNIVIIANNGQKQFNTPLPIVDIRKIAIYRNGVRIDFTTINDNTIELESEVICYQNDKIRIVQIL